MSKKQTMPKKIVVRVQSPQGTKRIEMSPTDSTNLMFEKVCEAFNLSSFAFALYKERNKKGEIISSKRKKLPTYDIKHGDMLYMAPFNGTYMPVNEPFSGTTTPSSESGADPFPATSSTSASVSRAAVTEDEVDVQLQKMDGTIERNKDERLCRHGDRGSCIHCSPLEPYSEKYLREQNIKHMSFHTYLRKLTGGVDKGKFAALENISCHIKPGCKDHPPWPKGICSKCQPNAVTLNRQVYRHVDNVMFENPHLVERFLTYWRTTGHQRLGLMYGRYEHHRDVPLGIKATVAAIYEPPQESTQDSISLLPDEKQELVDWISQQLGLSKVGWIFTDLVAEDMTKGTVKHFRHGASHFLSAQECIMAGHFQNMHPNPCRLSPDGTFGSKFVTVCVTGDASNQVHMEGYQVTNQCMALVADNCLLPTKDASELGYIKESSNEHYVPDVFYKEKDSYGNEVTKLARPLPVEYMLLDVPVSTPIQPHFTFYAENSIKPFPVENRLLDGHIQDFTALCNYMAQFQSDQFLNAVSDFHLLLYMTTMDMLPMKDFIGPLLKAVRTKDADLARDWSKSEHWATVEQLFAASSGSASPPVFHPRSDSFTETVSGAAGNSMWTCPHCTFLNHPEPTNCEMCNLPR